MALVGVSRSTAPEQTATKKETVILYLYLKIEINNKYFCKYPLLDREVSSFITFWILCEIKKIGNKKNPLLKFWGLQKWVIHRTIQLQNNMCICAQILIPSCKILVKIEITSYKFKIHYTFFNRSNANISNLSERCCLWENFYAVLLRIHCWFLNN